MLKCPSDSSSTNTSDGPSNFNMQATRKKLQEQIKSVTRYLTPLLPLANCHMVEFLTENHWDKLVPNDVRKELDSWDSIWDFDFTLNRFWELENTLCKDNTSLAVFIATSRYHCLAINDYCLSTDQLQRKLTSWGGSVKPEINITGFMNSKKSYEVASMSRLVASLYEATSSTCCLEAGGGRGHLLVALSRGYQVPSLTVDCDEDKLQTAAARVQMIQKQWHALTKRKKDGSSSDTTTPQAKCPNDAVLQNSATNLQTCDENLNRFDEDPQHSNKNLNHSVISPYHSTPNHSTAPHHSTAPRHSTTPRHSTNPFHPDISPVKLHRFATTYITKDTNLVAVVEEKFPELTDNVKLLLTGLHTCGDLGPSSLRIFTRRPSTSAVFTVPCCYHLLTEGVGEDSGFPMSKYLKGYTLGRNARMLAAQSLDRVVNERQMPAKSLLYRALLQVIIKNHLPQANISEGRLKRLSSKCDNFEQYFKAADAILDLGLFDSLPQSCLKEICKDIDRQWRKLVIFYLLRMCLAQVIESVILLDRLMYLYENDFEKVFLVKLFDPVLSPRCHGIVAVR